MTDNSELVQRLRGVNWVCAIYGKTEVLHDTVCHEAAYAIEALEKRIEELGAALKPFAEQAEFIAVDNGSLLNGLCSPVMSKKDFFAARKALGDNK